MTDLVLRPWREDDAESLLVVSGSDDVELAGGPLETEEQARQWIHDLSVAAAVGRNVAWAITVDDLPVGGVALSRIEREHRTAQISYWLAEFTRGLGLASRATAAVAAYGFQEMGLARIELAHQGNHPKSRAVATAAGFVPEGVQRSKVEYGHERFDVEMHSRLADDPVPNIELLPITD